MVKGLVAVFGIMLVLSVGFFIYSSNQSTQSSKNSQKDHPNEVTEAIKTNTNSENTNLPAQNSAATQSAQPNTSEATGSTSTGSTSTTPALNTTHSNSTTSLPPTTTASTTNHEPNCFSFEYQHKSAAKNRDIEDFLDYSNGFSIEHSDLNAKTLCVKVNNKPVQYSLSTYQGKKEVILGSIVGPESKIQISYCVGKASCKTPCEIKKDRALDEMLSDQDDTLNLDSAWDSGSPQDQAKSAQQKNKLAAQAKEMRNLASQNDHLAKTNLFRDWQTLKTNHSVCNK